MKTFGTSVITCVTSQNTVGVDGIHVLPTEMIEKQIRAVLTDIGTNAIKTGMLYSTEIIETVCKTLEFYFPNSKPIRNLVVDPVMVASSGASLLDPNAIDSVRKRLLPLTHILTPNIPEAELLVGKRGILFY